MAKPKLKKNERRLWSFTITMQGREEYRWEAKCGVHVECGWQPTLKAAVASALVAAERVQRKWDEASNAKKSVADCNGDGK